MPIVAALLPLIFPPSVQAREELFRFDRLDDLASYNPGGQNRPLLQVMTTPGLTPGIRVTFDNPGNPWDAQIGRPALGAVREGDAIRFQFSARMTGTGTIVAVFEQASPPNTKIIAQPVGADGTWRSFQITRQTGASYAAGETSIKFFFVGKGVAELSNVAVTNLGGIAGPFGIDDKVGSFKRQRDEALLRTARNNIATMRRGPLALTVLGKNGKPLANASVRVQETRSAFRWGTAVVADLLNSNTPEAERYKAIVAREFNTVVFENDLKWRDDSPAPLNAALRAMPWLAAHDIRVRGHNLVWGADQYLPTVVKQAPNDAKWPLIQAHIREYAGATKGKVYVWDVVNEAVTNTQLWEQIGWDKFPAVYKLTHQVDPKAALAYNEYNIQIPSHRKIAIQRVKALQAAGAPVTLFGDQGHYGLPEPSARAVWDGWEEIRTATGLPIEITEYDFGTPDDAVYAEQIEDAMTLAFGHPSMRGFVMWGFWEGAHWRAREGGAIVRRDFSYRAPMTKFHDLVHRVWNTDATLKTDARGRLRLPAYYGTYRVSAGTMNAVVTHAAPAKAGGITTATVRLR